MTNLQFGNSRGTGRRYHHTSSYFDCVLFAYTCAKFKLLGIWTGFRTMRSIKIVYPYFQLSRWIPEINATSTTEL